MEGFFKEYFLWYPQRLMLRLKEGDIVQVERFKEVLEARVVQVDCSLVKVQYMIDHGTCSVFCILCRKDEDVGALLCSIPSCFLFCSCSLEQERILWRKRGTSGCIEAPIAWPLCLWKEEEDWSVVILKAVQLNTSDFFY